MAKKRKVIILDDGTEYVIFRGYLSYFMNTRFVFDMHMGLAGCDNYPKLLKDISLSKLEYGESFDVEFITKVTPRVHWKAYLCRWVDEQTPRRAWRVWQCLEYFTPYPDEFLEVLERK